jgi:MFS family permease
LFSFLFQIKRQVRHNFKCDLGGAIFYGLFYGGLNSFILVQARRLGATAFEVGLLAALPSIWLMLSPVWAKRFASKNPFKMVFFGDGISRALIVLLLFSVSVHWYLILFTMHYFFASISATVYGNAMQQAYPAETRGTLMGWVRVGSALAQIISIVVSGILLPIWGVGYLFPFLALFGVGSALMFSRMKRAMQAEPDHEGPKISAAQIFKTDHDYRRFVVALFFFGLAWSTALPAYPLFQVDALKVSDGFIATFSTIVLCSSLFFYYIGGRLIDRYSPLKVMMGIFLVNLLIPLAYCFTTNQWPLLFIALMQGVVNAAIDLVIINCVLCMTKKGEINSYMAINVYLQGLRGTIGPLLAPCLIHLFGYKGLFIIVFAINLVGVWQLLPLIKSNNRMSHRDENFTTAGIE